MKTQIKKIGTTLLYMTMTVLIMSQSAKAVAFKLKNDTEFTIRAKVNDRGKWRNYVQVNPGQCKDIATEVERTEHSVVIQMKTSSGWETIYSDHHGSRMFTRIVRVSDNKNGYYFAWYDEPHGCRDCPNSKGHGCLLKSGWVNLSSAIKVGKFLGKAVFKAEGK